MSLLSFRLRRLTDLKIAIGIVLHNNPTPILLLGGVVAPASGTFLVTYGQNRHGRGDWTALLSGIAIIFLGALLLFAKQRASDQVAELDLKVADRFRITLKDAMQPVAELIADMPAQSKLKRKATIRTVCTQAVSALTLLLKDVSRLRATVYEVTANGNMECVSYHGRGGGVKPNPFIKNTTRGDSALRLVATGGDPLFVGDIDTVEGIDYGGTGSGYKTFISASIHNDADGYGMVTIDAPRPGSLVDTDKQLVGLVADLLAIAFAIAEH
ncbi:GAF domain-containing protein [Mycobacterium kansasii]